MSRHIIGDTMYFVTGAGEENLLQVAPLPYARPNPVWLLSPHGCSCDTFIRAMLHTGKGKCEHHDWLVNLLPSGLGKTA